MELSNAARVLRGRRASLPLIEDEFFNINLDELTIPQYDPNMVTSANEIANCCGVTVEEILGGISEWVAARGVSKTSTELEAMLRSFVREASIGQLSQESDSIWIKDDETRPQSESLDAFLKEFERKNPNDAE